MNNNFKNKLRIFMQGRYGADELYKFTVILTGIFIVIDIFTSAFLKISLLSGLIILMIAWSYFRFFSRNIYKRQNENRKYLKCRDNVKSFFRISKLRFRDRKTYSYRRCPVCKKMLRLPKRKGKHTVNCPECKNDFNVKI